jgi:hypothetical protein
MSQREPDSEAQREEADEQPQPVGGWIEAAARLVQAVIKSGRAQENLQVILGSIDPDAGSKLVKALLYTDLQLPLAVVGALPDATNVAIEVGTSLIKEIAAHPVELVDQVTRSLLARVRVRTLGRGAGHLLTLALKLHRLPGEPWFDALHEELRAGADEVTQQQLGLDAGEALAALAQGLDELLDRRPELRQELIEPFMRALQLGGGS